MSAMGQRFYSFMALKTQRFTSIRSFSKCFFYIDCQTFLLDSAIFYLLHPLPPIPPPLSGNLFLLDLFICLTKRIKHGATGWSRCSMLIIISVGRVECSWLLTCSHVIFSSLMLAAVFGSIFDLDKKTFFVIKFQNKVCAHKKMICWG